MIEKKTIIQQIEILADGNVQVRLQLLTLEDGEVLASAWHRTSIQPGVDLDAQMAMVNTHLSQMKKEPVVEGCMARLRAHVAVAHTEEVVAAYAARIAQEEAKSGG